MQRLTGLESLFLNLESARWPMHGAGIAIVDPSTAPEGFGYETLRRVLEERLHLVPLLRRRIVEVPFGLDQPVWIEDPDFDLGYHLHRVGVPAPGGLRELADLAVELCGPPLDRTRPLWEIWYVEGLEHGHVAVIEKMHHACTDGMGGIELISRLFDREPSPREVPPPPEPWEPEPVPSPVDMLVRALPSIAATPVRIARSAMQISEGVRRGRQRKDEEDHEPGRSFRAPRVSFNGTVAGTPHKALAFVSLAMADVQLVKQTFGVTVNDVVLAACAGSLRRYLDGRNELPQEPLTVCAPVNVRTEDEHGLPGVHVSLMFTPIATDIEDPVERLQEIHASTSATKHVHAARGTGVMKTIVELPSPNIWVMLSHLIEARHLGALLPPMFNACISNIVGPSETLYLGGARLLHHYVLGMLYESIGLFIPLISYADSIDIGITAVRELTPDPWPIADGVREALHELVKAAEEVGP